MMRDEAVNDLTERLQARLNGVALVALGQGRAPVIPTDAAAALAVVAAEWAEEHEAAFTEAGKVPTLAELQLLASDVGYELKMLAAVAPMGAPDELTALGNALLEDALLHIRNVDSFLGAVDVADDDVSAMHYLDSWSPVHFLTRGERDDINKRLMHLSRQRSRLSTVWVRPPIAARALAAFDEFYRRLVDVHPSRAEWFDEDVATAKRLLANPVAIALV